MRALAVGTRIGRARIAVIAITGARRRAFGRALARFLRITIEIPGGCFALVELGREHIGVGA
jgi:hypothetical protein